jgi:signal transduction histidine kinase
MRQFRFSIGLQTKLTLTFLLLVCLMAAAFLFVALNAVQLEERRAFEARALSITGLLAANIRNISSSDMFFAQTKFLLKNVRAQPQVRYVYMYDFGGTILADGTETNQAFNTVPGDSFHLNALRNENTLLLQYRDRNFLARGNILDVAQPVLLPSGELVGGVQIGFDPSLAQQKVLETRKYIIGIASLFAVVGAMLSTVISRQLVRPIRDLVRGTESIASGNLDVRIPVRSRDELGGLAVSFNAMAAGLKENALALQRYAEELESKIEARTRELQTTNQRLEETSRHKSQFLANMSHELRTPLNAIIGYTSLILNKVYGEVPGTIREQLDRVLISSRHLLGLINDVLDLSKIEAGRLTLNVADFSLKQVIQSVVTATEPLAAEKKLALTASLPAELPAARGDARRINQVLLNLVGNAIKFTDSGEVSVRAAVVDHEFMLSVADTGPGVAEVDRETIFEEFRQAGNSDAPLKGGTGLGLAIAKKIVEAHGGRMGVESAPGRGSTFWFTLPVQFERRAEAS